MKNLLFVALLIGFSLQGAVASQPLRLDGPEGERALAAMSQRVIGAETQTTHTLLVWTRPPVEGRRYALRGRVQYSGVQGEGYLEMWNHFGDQGSYFSRTLASEGPLAALTGDSVEREFVLPFDRGETATPPARVELNVVLPGPGAVSVHGLRWDQIGTSALGGAWWSTQQAGALGGLIGAALGLAGALVGVLCSLGRGRRVAMTALTTEGIVGVAALGGAVFAAYTAQPAHVVFPLAGLGLLAAGGGILGRHLTVRRFRDLEFRKMRALDLSPASSGH